MQKRKCTLGRLKENKKKNAENEKRDTGDGKALEKSGVEQKVAIREKKGRGKDGKRKIGGDTEIEGGRVKMKENKRGKGKDNEEERDVKRRKK